MDFRDHTVQVVGNTVSIGTIVSVLAGVLPVAASAIAFVWYVIQIHESETWRKRITRRRQRRIAKLRAELIYLETMSRPLPTSEPDAASSDASAVQ